MKKEIACVTIENNKIGWLETLCSVEAILLMLDRPRLI